MRKRVLFIILLYVIVISGCSKSAGQINVSDFQCMEEEYCFRSLAWGSDMQEVEKSLGIKLEEVKEMSPGTYEMSQGKGITFLDVKGRMLFYFEDDGLVDLSFQAKGDETLEEFYDQVADKFTEEFGECSDTLVNSGTYGNLTTDFLLQRWDGENGTSLQIILGKGESTNHSVTVGILKSKEDTQR